MRKALNSFKETHKRLLERSGSEDARSLLPDVDDFIADLCQAGTYVPPGDGRNMVRSLAMYWGSYVFDHTSVYPKTELEPYTGSGARWRTSARIAVIVVVAGILVIFLSQLVLGGTNQSSNKDETADARQLVASWDFEDCTSGSWGVYDSVIVQSPDVTPSTEMARGQCSLAVSNISDQVVDEHGLVGYQKLIGAEYFGDLSNARLAALICSPATLMRGADAKFFLFSGEAWSWLESPEGGPLQPGACVERTWDLSKSPSTVSLRDIVGIKLFVPSEFTGSIYVDNVAIYK